MLLNNAQVGTANSIQIRQCIFVYCEIKQNKSALAVKRSSYLTLRKIENYANIYDIWKLLLFKNLMKRQKIAVTLSVFCLN